MGRFRDLRAGEKFILEAELGQAEYLPETLRGWDGDGEYEVLMDADGVYLRRVPNNG